MYLLDFPVEQGDSWWIDKENGYFVCAGLTAQYEPSVAENEEDELSRELSNGLNLTDKPKLPQAGKEMSHDRCDHGAYSCCPEKSIEIAMRECKLGNLSFMKDYLRDSPEASLFLKGSDDSGRTMLMFAVAIKSTELVNLLLDQGADPNVKDIEGRTALMHAALWDRYSNVRYLDGQGADQMLKAHDAQTASYIATTDRQTKEEDHLHLPVTGNHEDDAYVRDLNRRQIVYFLSEIHDGQNAVPEVNMYPDPLSFDREFRYISVFNQNYKQAQNLYITHERKTVAILQRPGAHQDIYAMSGWSRNSYEIYLDGEEWTQRAMDLAIIVGHQLSEFSREDNQVPGKFSASHAEKQLVAKFISMHVWEPRDYERRATAADVANIQEKLRRLEESSADVKNGVPCTKDLILGVEKLREMLDQLMESRRSLEQLHNAWDKQGESRGLNEDFESRFESVSRRGIAFLKDRSDIELDPDVREYRHQTELLDPAEHSWGMQTVQPSVGGLSEAKIFVSSASGSVCDDCVQFIEKVNMYYGVNITAIESTRL